MKITIEDASVEDRVSLALDMGNGLSQKEWIEFLKNLHETAEAALSDADVEREDHEWVSYGEDEAAQ
jgi:hypothetical protein